MAIKLTIGVLINQICQRHNPLCASVLVYIAAAFVIIPLTSVIYEIVKLGSVGFSFGIFTDDMAESSSESALTEGGLLHAVIGTAYIVTFATLLATPIGTPMIIANIPVTMVP